MLALHNMLSRQKRKTILSPTELLWRNMNVSAHLQGRVDISRAQRKPLDIDVASDSGQSASTSTQQASNIPVDLLPARSFKGMTDKPSESSLFINHKIWNAQMVKSQVCHNVYVPSHQHLPEGNAKTANAQWADGRNRISEPSHASETPFVVLSNSEVVARWKESRLEEKENYPMEVAKEVFMGLDADKSGFIEGSELQDLSLWAWENFYFGKPNPSGDELDEVLDKLLYAMDKDREGKISLDNFTKWFVDACDDVIKYQQNFTDLAPFFYRS